MYHLEALMGLAAWCAIGAVIGYATLPWKEGSKGHWITIWALGSLLLALWYLKEGFVRYRKKWWDYQAYQDWLKQNPQRK